MTQDKHALRQLAHTQRASILRSQTDGMTVAVAQKVLEYIRNIPGVGMVAGYMPINDELDIIPAVALLEQDGYRIALPVITNTHQPLDFYPWKTEEETHPSRVFPRVQEPLQRDAPVIPDIILVPLLGFDQYGHRLGYGGGFYDRTLHQLRSVEKPVLAIGVAYEAQKITTIPVESTDQCLDIIITESHIYQF